MFREFVYRVKLEFNRKENPREPRDLPSALTFLNNQEYLDSDPYKQRARIRQLKGIINRFYANGCLSVVNGTGLKYVETKGDKNVYRNSEIPDFVLVKCGEEQCLCYTTWEDFCAWRIMGNGFTVNQISIFNAKKHEQTKYDLRNKGNILCSVV